MADLPEHYDVSDNDERPHKDSPTENGEDTIDTISTVLYYLYHY